MVFRYYMRTSGSPVSTVISKLTPEAAMELLFPSLLLSYILSFIPPIRTSACQLAVLLLSTVNVIPVTTWLDTNFRYTASPAVMSHSVEQVPLTGYTVLP